MSDDEQGNTPTNSEIEVILLDQKACESEFALRTQQLAQLGRELRNIPGLRERLESLRFTESWDLAQHMLSVL